MPKPHLHQAQHQTSRWYRLKVVSLALLGLSFTSFWLMVLIIFEISFIGTILYGEVSIGLKIACAVMAVLLLFAIIGFTRAFFIRSQRPEGIELTAKSAPLLFQEIARQRQKLRCQRLDKVLLTTDFNAAVLSVPRLIRRDRSYLLLGAPLMAALDTATFRAVLAHEMGHISRQHDRLSNWVYRLREGWKYAHDAAWSAPGGFQRAPIAFYRWFIPTFETYSFALARANEFQADQAAVHVAGKQTTAQALCQISSIGLWLDQHYWRYVNRPKRQFTLSTQVISKQVASLAKIKSHQLQHYLEQALNESSDEFDSHPSLSERLTALEARAVCQTVPDQSALAHCLPSETIGPLLEQLDQVWFDESKEE